MLTSPTLKTLTSERCRLSVSRRPLYLATVSFSASTFHAVVPTPGRLAKRAHTYRASLGDDGRIAAFVLARMDGAATLDEIARAVMAAFPARFATWEAALTHVGALSEQYAG